MRRRFHTLFSDEGFTLLEVLVGLTISSLVMVGLASAMRSVNRSWEQSTERGERDAMLATGLHVAQGDIAHAERVFDDPAKPVRFLFIGDNHDVIFPLVERDNHNDHGLFWVHLFVRKVLGNIEFVRSRASFDPGPQDLNAIRWRDEVVLIHGQFDITLSYLAGGETRAWESSWPMQNQLPREVRIDIASVGTRNPVILPPAITSLRISAELPCVAADNGLCTLKSDGKLKPETGDKP